MTVLNTEQVTSTCVKNESWARSEDIKTKKKQKFSINSQILKVAFQNEVIIPVL
jgi:hypothetical protein